MDVTVSLHNLSDDEMKFVKQIGVDYVDVHPYALGFQPLNLKDAAMIIRKIREAGLKVLSYRLGPTALRDALMAKPEGEKQLEAVCELLRFLGSESVPLTWFGAGDTIRQGPRGVPGRYRRAHRGGYIMDAFSLELMRKEMVERDMSARWAHHFKEKLTPEDYFSNYVKVLEKIVPVAEESNVKLMSPFDDPPVPNFEGLLPGITNTVMIRRLLEAAPSKNWGMLFCVGTRYESGEDVYQQIRLLGNKIFYVHFRNVRGTLPSTGEYEEVSLDDGDMDMFRVLKTLKEVGYEGALHPDHTPIMIEDEKGRASLAFAVGYIKALISVLS